MVVVWNRHRFSGGVLALDVANTVVLRGDARSFDRFDDPAEIARFAEAAETFRAEELAGGRFDVCDARAAAPRVIAIRETCDRLFRASAETRALETALLPDFLRACADGLEANRPTTYQAGLPPRRPFEAVLAQSALSLLPADKASKIRICRNCNWLFLDRSRNGSRLWCDMTVCGNRSKAKRHYRRRKASHQETENA